MAYHPFPMLLALGHDSYFPVGFPATKGGMILCSRWGAVDMHRVGGGGVEGS